jgi:hypothetical protein
MEIQATLVLWEEMRVVDRILAPVDKEVGQSRDRKAPLPDFDQTSLPTPTNLLWRKDLVIDDIGVNYITKLR